MKLKWAYILIAIGCFMQATNAYVVTRTTVGKKAYWRSGKTNFTVNVNPVNSQMDSDDALTIIQNSFSEWGSKTGNNFKINQTSTTFVNASNDLFFSSDDSLFSGSAVVAVTQVAIDDSTGEILEADIIVNDNQNLSQITTNSAYLGNAITHEIGHFLGLSHGQVKGSSMFFSLAVSQHTVSTDDLGGFQSIYKRFSNLGTISGKVIGGTNKTGVFGSHIQAISKKTNKVIAGAFSETDGTFSIEGLPLDDKYLLYISPPKKLDTMPLYFYTSQTLFCSGSQPYRGSFFESCYSEDIGHPQEIVLDSTHSQVSVGEITIRCKLESPIAYSVFKSGTYNFRDNLNTDDFSRSMVGFFSKNDIANTTPDNIKIDLSDFDVQGTGHYLEVKIKHHAFYSQLRTLLEVDQPGQFIKNYPEGLDGFGLIYDEDNTPTFDYTVRVALDQGVSPNNEIDLKVIPYDVDDFMEGLGGFFSEEYFFPEYDSFKDDLGFYLLSADIVKKEGDDWVFVKSPEYRTIKDNATCPQAPGTVSIRANVPPEVAADGTSAAPLKSNDKNPLSVSCGAVSIIGGGGPKGPGPWSGLPVGLILILLLPRFQVGRANSRNV